MNVNVRYRLGWFQKIRDFLWFFDDSLDLERQQRLNNFRLRPTFNINFSKWFFFSSTLIVYTVRAVHEFNHNLLCALSMCEIPFCIYFLTFHTIFGFQCDTPQLMWIVFFIMIRNEIPPLGNSNEGRTANMRKFQHQTTTTTTTTTVEEEEAKTKCTFTLFQKVLLLHSFYWTFCSHRRQFSHFIAFSFLKYAI